MDLLMAVTNQNGSLRVRMSNEFDPALLDKVVYMAAVVSAKARGETLEDFITSVLKHTETEETNEQIH